MFERKPKVVSEPSTPPVWRQKLLVNADLSEAALEQALIDIGEEHKKDYPNTARFGYMPHDIGHFTIKCGYHNLKLAANLALSLDYLDKNVTLIIDPLMQWDAWEVEFPTKDKIYQVWSPGA